MNSDDISISDVWSGSFIYLHPERKNLGLSQVTGDPQNTKSRRKVLDDFWGSLTLGNLQVESQDLSQKNVESTWVNQSKWKLLTVLHQKLGVDEQKQGFNQSKWKFKKQQFGFQHLDWVETKHIDMEPNCPATIGFRIVENEPNSQVLVSGEKLPSIALKLVQQAAHNCFLPHLQPLLALLPHLLLWQVEGCMNPSANSCRIRYLWYPQISRRLTVNTTLIATYCNLLYLDALTVAGFLASWHALMQRKR